MIVSLGIALREGIEAALIVGIVLLYLARTGQRGLRGYVYAGVGVAALASVALAVVFAAAGLDVENPFFEGALLGIAGVLVITMVLWMRRAARSLRGEMETRLDSITANRSGAALGWGIFAFVFFMVLREGAELVLFLKAASIGSQASAADLVGALVGLGLAVLFAVLFVRGSVHVNISRFLRLTSWALLLLGAKLLLGSLHEFGEVGALPFGNAFFEEAGELTKGVAGDILMGVVIAVPVALLLWDMSKPWRGRWSKPVGKPQGSRRRGVEAADDRH
jgi:high-affinity iron transporter